MSNPTSGDAGRGGVMGGRGCVQDGEGTLVFRWGIKGGSLEPRSMGQAGSNRGPGGVHGAVGAWKGCARVGYPQ